MTGSSPSSAADSLLDAFYTAVGLGVLAVNRAQVARRDAARSRARSGAPDATGPNPVHLLRQVAADPEALRTIVSRLHHELQAIDDLVLEVERRLDEILERIEPDLPEPGRELVHFARATGKDLGAQARAVLGLRVP